MDISRENLQKINTFSGSGSTILSAIKEKRKAIGCEINKEFHRASSKKLDYILRAPKLF